MSISSIGAIKVRKRSTGENSRKVAGFTLVEVLLVVLMLGLIAAIVIPQFSNAAAEARASCLRDNIRLVRTQIALFKHHHIGVPPGYPDGDTNTAPTEAAFLDQMTRSSNADCQTADYGTAGYDFGPYFNELTANPVNGKATIQVIGNSGTFPTEADNSHGYIYQPFTQTFKADSSGTDEAGTSFFAY